MIRTDSEVLICPTWGLWQIPTIAMLKRSTFSNPSTHDYGSHPMAFHPYNLGGAGTQNGSLICIQRHILGVQLPRHPVPPPEEKVWRDHKKIPIKHEAYLRRYDWTQVCIKTLLETFFFPHKKGELFFLNRINLQFWGKCVLKATRSACSDKNKETYWWWRGLGFILPETNIEPENWWLKDRFPLRKAYLRGSSSPGSGIIFSLKICPA